MSQAYPGAPVPYGAPYGSPDASRYRSLRRPAVISVVLMALTAVAAAIQTVLLWSSYDDVKHLVYGLLSDDEVARGVDAISGAGPFLDLFNYLLLGTGAAFLIWLWRARENTEILAGPPKAQEQLQPQLDTHLGAYPAERPANGGHRHSRGWVVGSWFCPIAQFWYPLQVVQDVCDASEPPTRHPGAVRSGGTHSLLYGWWAAWTGLWAVIIGGGLYTLVSMVVLIVQLVDAQETSATAGDYVDIYDLQDFMVRLALGICIGATVATVLLIVAGVLISVVVLRVTNWQDERSRRPAPSSGPAVPAGPRFYGPPGYSGGPAPGQTVVPPRSDPAFPSYGGYRQQPPGGPPADYRP